MMQITRPMVWGSLIAKETRSGVKIRVHMIAYETIAGALEYNEAIKIEVVTKRDVLKVVASIYDPLGILSSFVINLKLLLQEVCALNCDWDITLPEEFCRKWKKALSSLKDMDLPRFYLNCFELKTLLCSGLKGRRALLASQTPRLSLLLLEFFLFWR